MFSDIAQHWASECIVALAQRQVIQGYPNGTFRPNAVVSRAEFAALMQRVFPDVPIRKSQVVFTDVFAEFWASDAIVWAAERGLFSGYSDNRFLPNQTISRVQALVVLVAGLSATQSSEAVSAPEASMAAQGLAKKIEQTFSDAAEIPAYARDAIGNAIASGLLVSLPEPRALLPGQSITRGEVAALLCRALAIPATELAREYPGLAQDKRSLFKRFLGQESGFNAEKLAFLDRTIVRSPYRKDIKSAAIRLQQSDPLARAVPLTLESAADYPSRGSRPMMDASGLDFLSSEILSGCVCLSTTEGGRLKTKWLGREAFVNQQMWSSTKFIPLLNLVDRVNGIAPTTDLDQCLVRRAGGQGGFPFNSLAAGIMSYDNRIATSNSLAAMFKHFNTPAGLEKWTQQLTGNQQLSFQGRYGEVPFIQYPELWDRKSNRVLLKSPRQDHRGQNLVSTYDLTRLITMAGWHWQLPRQSIIPNVQTHSLESVLRAMGVDTARYVDVALEALGLSGWVRSPVILSKSGFGRSDLRDRTELTYCALVQFSLPRINAADGATDPTASHQQYSFGLTLIAAQRTGDANQESRFVDALMATEVTEIIRRIVNGQLR
ncbi:MAG: S-layer homology domain-containing protein [Cyanobacteria bacterium J06621_11]